MPFEEPPAGPAISQEAWQAS